MKMLFLLFLFVFLSVKESTSHLRVVDLLVLIAGFHKIVVLSAADDPAFIDNEDKIASLNGAYSLRYGYDCGIGKGF